MTQQNINQTKQSMRESMEPVVWNETNIVYGNTPTFLGATHVKDEKELEGLDAVIAGLPWEGTNTWGSYSECEITPKAIRNASLRYGTGFIPEYNVEVMKHIKLGDYGDFASYPNNNELTIKSFFEGAESIFRHNVVPFFFGGDHSVTYPVIKALSKRHSKKMGIIHFDAHLDNSDEYNGDRFARCSPLRRIVELSDIDSSKIVHFGIRGPRNSPQQMQFVKDNGIPIFTMKEIRERGFFETLITAKKIAEEGTDGYYITICSDIIDHAFNPGGAIDFGGITSTEMLTALYTLCQGNLLGMDIVEIYPRWDTHETSIHLATWMAIYGLAGLSIKLKSNSSLYSD